MPEREKASQNSQASSSTSTAAPRKGIAAMFEKEELKDLFIKYLILIGVIEGFIFFVSFLSQLGPENTPFPWKSYFFAAFIVPLTITFLLGVIVLGFDRYLYGHQPESSEGPLGLSASEQQGRVQKFHAFIYVIRQMPFLMGLLMLVVLSGVVYKLDGILAVIGHVGERTAYYLLITLAVLLVASVVLGLVWMFMSYSLRKKSMEYQYKYKKDVVDKTGLIILEGDRVMDQHGKLLTHDHVAQIEQRDDEDGDNNDTILIE
ncbi:MAG: hypothetical protein BA874_01175 [Desulfuromonadales bacterium C00003068]|jgi:hypothetical protein|nr:MAG: hypothetical protein BA874_01175 [Desulfuromonadales bacterium C00003068]